MKGRYCINSSCDNDAMERRSVCADCHRESEKKRVRKLQSVNGLPEEVYPDIDMDAVEQFIIDDACKEARKRIPPPTIIEEKLWGSDVSDIEIITVGQSYFHLISKMR